MFNHKYALRILKLIFGLIFLIFLGYIALFSLIIFGPKAKNYFQQTSFESQTWKNSNGTNNVRQKMISDLFAKYSLVGMNRKNIDDLLGTPKRSSYFREFDYVYRLGLEKGLGVDSEWLCIKFKNDIVIEVKILTD